MRGDLEDGDTLGFEPPDLQDARLDAVDRRQDVKAGESRIARRERSDGGRGAKELEVDTARRSLDEPQIRLALAVGDQDDAHLTSIVQACGAY